jgi:hypothetical protein
VTLCTISESVEEALFSSIGKAPRILPLISSGDIYYPSSSRGDDEHLSHVRLWNRSLCSDGISFATEILMRSINLLMSGNVLPTKDDDAHLLEILPCLASAISLIPSCIPTLSIKYAMELLPLVTRCAKLVDRMIHSRGASLGIELESGEWTICVDSSTSDGDSRGSSDNSESYAVRFDRISEHGIETDYSFYQGNELNNRFSIIGASSGTHVQFVEEWRAAESPADGDTSSFEEYAKRSTASFIIDARLNLDGTKFVGVRHNLDKGLAEPVSGFLQRESSTAEIARSKCVTEHLVKTESLLCLAVGHLSLILCSQTSISDLDRDEVESSSVNRSLNTLLSGSHILSKGRLHRDGSTVRCAIDSVWKRCRPCGMYSDMVEQWHELISFDLLSATDSSHSTENGSIIEETRSIIEKHSIGLKAAEQGSFSRICPQEYKAAQVAIASAILYHVKGFTEVSQSEIASQAWRKSLQIMEDGIREALTGAETGVTRKDVCENRCLLYTLISQFLYEFPCTSDDQSMQSIFDDITLIFKCIKSSEWLDYIKLQMGLSTKKSIMHYLGLRSLQLLLEADSDFEGVRVYAAIESTLVSLPQLLRCPALELSTSEIKSKQGSSTQHTAIIPGCAASIQTCIHACTRKIYRHIGTFLTAKEGPLRDDCLSSSTSLLLVLLANCFTAFHPNACIGTISEMLSSLKIIAGQCRDRALRPNHDKEATPVSQLFDAIRKQENGCLLQTSASVSLSYCAQSSLGSFGSSHLIDLFSEHLLQELSATCSLVVEETILINDREVFEAVHSDLIDCEGSTESRIKGHQSADMFSSKGLAYLSRFGNMFPKQDMPLSESSATIYFRQLLNILHVVINTHSFMKSITKGAGTLFSAFGFVPTDENQGIQQSALKRDSLLLNGLPPRFSQRILRLLRPILLSTNPGSLAIQQLFCMAGSVVDASGNHGCVNHSHENLLVARSLISLLRYIYTYSKIWRKEIRQKIISCQFHGSPMFRGVLAFFGGYPGLLYPGAFVVIEPEGAAMSSASTKYRSSSSALAAASKSAITSFGSGADEIVSGLCRHHSQSGVVSSIDSRSGSCEVIILNDKHFQLTPSAHRDSHPAGASKVTIRAVRISAANVSAADEFPFVLEDTYLSGDSIFESLSGVFKSVSALIKAAWNSFSSDGEFKNLEIDVEELMECCQSLRSSAVLISQTRVFDKLVADKSGGLRLLLARA